MTEPTFEEAVATARAVVDFETYFALHAALSRARSLATVPPGDGTEYERGLRSAGEFALTGCFPRQVPTDPSPDREP